MSGVIKLAEQAGQAAINRLPRERIVRRSPEEEEMDRLRGRIAELEAESGKHEKAMAALRTDAFEAGQKTGHQAGLREAQDRQDERLTLLEAALGEAVGELRLGIEEMERIAVAIARESLDMMFDEAEQRSSLVVDLIHKQVSKIDRSLLLELLVSSEDFPDDAALSLVAARIGLSPRTITAGGHVKPGDCEMRMQLGRIEIGLNRQWGAIAEALAEMSQPADRA